MMTASRPSTAPSASISTQSFFASAGFSERVVFIGRVSRNQQEAAYDGIPARGQVVLERYPDTTNDRPQPFPPRGRSKGRLSRPFGVVDCQHLDLLEAARAAQHDHVARPGADEGTGDR